MVQGTGGLRERVAFEKRVASSDDYGNPIAGDFVFEFETWARIRPLIGGEAVLAARLGGEQPVVITVHYSDQTKTITTDWRARDARLGTLYNIRSVANNDERKAYLDITAASGQATG